MTRTKENADIQSNESQIELAGLRYSGVHKFKRAHNFDLIEALVVILMRKYETNCGHTALQIRAALTELQVKRKKLGSSSLDVALSLNAVGTILFQQDDLDNALKFFEEELKIEESITGPEDLRMYVSCNNIGRIYQDTNRFPEAIEYYLRASRIGHLCEANEKEASLTAVRLCSTVWYNLGLIYDDLKSSCEALRAFKMALHFRKLLLGSDNEDVACLLFNITVLQVEHKLSDEAILSITELLRIRKSVGSINVAEKSIINVLQKLASMYKSDGRIQSALRVLSELLYIQRDSTEMEVSHKRFGLGVTLRKIAQLYGEEGHLNIAVKSVKESISMLEPLARRDSNFPSESICVELASSLLLLGSLLHETSEPLSAKNVFHEAIIVIDTAIKGGNAHSPTWNALREINLILATASCAPAA